MTLYREKRQECCCEAICQDVCRRLADRRLNEGGHFIVSNIFNTEYNIYHWSGGKASWSFDEYHF